MRFFLTIAVVLLATQTPAQEDPRRAAAEAFVKSTGQQAMMDSMLSPEGVMSQMGLVQGQLPEEKMAALAAIVSEEISSIRPTMEAAIVDGMSEAFSLEEIEALTNFYNSGPGASAMTKMNAYMSQVMQRIGPDFQEAQGRMMQRMQAEMSR